jgi:hypothetical protein
MSLSVERRKSQGQLFLPVKGFSPRPSPLRSLPRLLKCLDFYSFFWSDTESGFFFLWKKKKPWKKGSTDYRPGGAA